MGLNSRNLDTIFLTIYVQNPADCGSARKVVCDLLMACGFGCAIHHLVLCLITAYRAVHLDYHSKNMLRY